MCPAIKPLEVLKINIFSGQIFILCSLCDSIVIVVGLFPPPHLWWIGYWQ